MTHEEKAKFLEEHDFYYNPLLEGYLRCYRRDLNDGTTLEIKNIITPKEFEAYQKEGLTILIDHIDEKNQQAFQAQLNKDVELPSNIHDVANKNHHVARLFREFKDGHFSYTTFIERILYLMTGVQY